MATPQITAVKCASRCASHGRVQNGGVVKIRGQRLSSTRRIGFLGGPGRSDDVYVGVHPKIDTNVSVRVPYSASSGPLSAWVSARVHSKPSKRLTVVPSPPPQPSPNLTAARGPADPGSPQIETAVSTGRYLFDSATGVAFSYRLADSTPDSVSVALVRVSDGSVLHTWTADAVAPGEKQTVTWSGIENGKVQPDGRYAFRLVAHSPSGATARNAANDDPQRDAFDLHGYTFPLRGKHSYGTGVDRFGAPRSGHRHEGQDVLAACGTPIVAARGGVVKAKRYQSAAGNYVAIDARGTGIDFFYAHLRSPSPLSVGDRVYTGERIGNVGDTGDAHGCHLHFEMWTSPGWYSGGHPFDPLSYLKAWDRYS